MTTSSGGVASARSFLGDLYAALRAARLNPVGASAVRESVERLRESMGSVLDERGQVAVALVRGSIYLNRRLMPNDVENFVFHEHVLTTLRGAGVGTLTFGGVPSREGLQAFCEVVVRLSGPDEDPERAALLASALESRSVRLVAVEPPIAAAQEIPGESDRRVSARRTYHASVAISRELFSGTRLGRGANVRQVKHVVQGIVDGVLTNEAALGGLSTLKDYDDYAFTHAVNVCIFCVAIGRRLGLSKAQLYDLGHAALVHDVGMSRIPREILTKGAALTPDERQRMESHTWLGALSVFGLRDYGDIPFHSMIVAYEHHMKQGGGGYPASLRARKPSVFSKIVAVAAAYDAATNERAYSKAQPADEVLRELWENQSLGLDPVIVKALINLLGIYPVGTCVILDTYELALVHAANADPAFVHRPTVRLLSDSEGRWLEPTPLVDLAVTKANGAFGRSIIKVTSPDKYGIKVSDYFA